MSTKRFWPEGVKKAEEKIPAQSAEFAKICGDMFQIFATAPEGFERKRALAGLIRLAELYGLRGLKK